MALQKQEDTVQVPIEGSPSSKQSKNKTVTMTFHIDPDLKQEVTEIVRDYGLNLSTVTRAFYKQIVRDGSIPLSFRYDTKSVADSDIALSGSSQR